MPKYRLHKGSGQAIVQLNGDRICLGKYGMDRSRKCYAEETAKLETPQPAYRRPAEGAADDAVAESAVAYLDSSEQYVGRGETGSRFPE